MVIISFIRFRGENPKGFPPLTRNVEGFMISNHNGLGFVTNLFPGFLYNYWCRVQLP